MASTQHQPAAAGRKRRRRQPGPPVQWATLTLPATRPSCGAWPTRCGAAWTRPEYKHVVLGLIFLKYISDAFEETRAQLVAEQEEGADPEHPGRVPGAERFLGAAGGALVKAEGTGAAGHSWRGHRQRHDGDRAGQPGAQGCAAQGVRPPRVGQEPAGQGGRPGEQHSGGRRGGARHRRAGQCVRVLPGAVRPGRGEEGGRVLHAAQRGAAAGGDAGALQGDAFTTPAAARRACSCSRWSSSAPTSAATATAARRARTFRSTGRSRTTRRGAWRG